MSDGQDDPGEERSFADPDTHFHLVRSQTARHVDGYSFGELTGEVECCECGAAASAPEYIAHGQDCSQRDVRSRYYHQTH